MAAVVRATGSATVAFSGPNPTVLTLSAATQTTDTLFLTGIVTSSSTISSITGCGATWTRLVTAGAFSEADIWIGRTPTAGQTTISITRTGGTRASYNALCVSGLNDTATIQTAGVSNPGSTNTASTPWLAPDVPSFMVAMIGDEWTNSGVTQSPGWTVLYTTDAGNEQNTLGYRTSMAAPVRLVNTYPAVQNTANPGGAIVAIPLASPPTFSAYSKSVLIDDPDVFWEMQETSGTVMADSAGRGRDGTYTNAPTLGAAGLFPGATSVQFDGSNDYAVWLDTTITRTTAAWTVEGWVQPNASTYSEGAFWTTNYDGGNVHMPLRVGAGNSRFESAFYASGWTFAEAQESFQAGTPYHVANVWTGTQLRLYVNGRLIAQSTPGFSPNPGSITSFLIGGGWGAGSTNLPSVFYAMRASHLAIWTSALNPAQIQAHYAAAQPPKATHRSTASNHNGNSTAVTLNLQTPTIAGDTFFVTGSGESNDITSVTGAGATWSRIVTSGNATEADIWIGKTPTVGSSAVTVNLTGTTDFAAVAVVIGGLDTTKTIQSSSTTTPASGTAWAAPSLTPTEASFVIAAEGDQAPSFVSITSVSGTPTGRWSNAASLVRSQQRASLTFNLRVESTESAAPVFNVSGSTGVGTVGLAIAAIPLATPVPSAYDYAGATDVVTTRANRRTAPVADTAPATDQLFLARTPYENAVMADVPLAYWKMDETFNQGGTFGAAHDSSGNLRDLALTTLPVGTSPYGATGLLARETSKTAAAVTGTTVTWTTSGTWTPTSTTGALSLEAWIKVLAGQTATMNVVAIPALRMFVNSPTAGTNPGCIGVEAWSTTTVQTFQSSVNVADGNTHHCVVTANGSTQTAKIYVDGILVLQSAMNNPLNTGTGSTAGAAIIGRRASNYEGMAGTYDEVAVYRSELSQARVLVHYSAGANVGLPTDSAPATDALTTTATRPRAVADTAAATDTVTGGTGLFQFITQSGITETNPGNDLFTLTAQTGTAVGDFQLAFAASHASLPVATPSGWTLVAAQTSTHQSLRVFSRILDAGNIASSITFTIQDNGALLVRTYRGPLSITVLQQGTGVTSPGLTAGRGRVIRAAASAADNLINHNASTIKPDLALVNPSSQVTYQFYGDYAVGDEQNVGTLPSRTAVSTPGSGVTLYPLYIDLLLSPNPVAAAADTAPATDIAYSRLGATAAGTAVVAQFGQVTSATGSASGTLYGTAPGSQLLLVGVPYGASGKAFSSVSSTPTLTWTATAHSPNSFDTKAIDVYTATSPGGNIAYTMSHGGTQTSIQAFEVANASSFVGVGVNTAATGTAGGTVLESSALTSDLVIGGWEKGTSSGGAVAPTPNHSPTTGWTTAQLVTPNGFNRQSVFWRPAQTGETGWQLGSSAPTTGSLSAFILVVKSQRTVQVADSAPAVDTVAAEANPRTSYAATVLADAPVSYWRLQETSGTTVRDLAGNVTGAYVGSPTLGVTPGPLKNFPDTAAQFASGKYATFGDVYDFVGSDFAVEFWMNNTSWAEAFSPVITKGDSTTNAWRIARNSSLNTSLQVVIGNLNNALTVNTTDGLWHHIVVSYTFSSKTAVFYVDGAALGGSPTGTSGPANNAFALQLAHNAEQTSRSYSGKLAEVAIYDHTLTAARVKAHYDAAVLGAVADSAPAADVVTSTRAFPRAVSDTASASDAAGRAVARALTATDTAPATDVTEWSNLALRFSDAPDLAPATDALVRSLSVARFTSDSAPAANTDSGVVASPVFINAPLAGADASLIAPTLATSVPIMAGSGQLLPPSTEYAVEQDASSSNGPISISSAVPTVLDADVFGEASPRRRLEGATSLDSPPLRRVSPTFPNPRAGLVNGRPGEGWVPTAITDVNWGYIHIIINGKDVTYVRGVKTRITQVRWQEPYGEGAAQLVCQGATEFDQGQPGFAWLREERAVRLHRMNPNGTYHSTIFAGKLLALEHDGTQWTLEVGGAFAGVAALFPHQPRVNDIERDLGSTIVFATRVTGGTSWRSIQDTPIGIPTRKRGSTSQSILDFVTDCLALAQEDDGSRWTLGRITGSPATYKLRKKDITTEHATIYPRAPGTRIQLKRDVSQATRRILGEGVNRKGGRWRGIKLPNIGKETVPPFTGNLTIGSTGDKVRLWQYEMSSDGYDVGTSFAIGSGVFTAKEAKAARQLQREAGLAVTGVVNEATWNATWSNGGKDMNLGGANIFPLAEDTRVKRWNYSSNGSKLSANPNYDPSVMAVGRLISYGENMAKSTARDSALNTIAYEKDPGWYGTITLAGVDPPERSKYELTEGMNVRVPWWNGTDAGILLHVAGVDWAESESGWDMTLTVDTKARDLLSIAEMIVRNREARQDPARKAVNQLRRSTQVRDVQIWDAEAGFGEIPARDCVGGKWNVFVVAAGPYGTLQRVRVDTTPATRFAVAIFGDKPGTKWLNTHFDNPLTALTGDNKDYTPWTVPGIADDLRDRLFIETFGGPGQAAGYSPGFETSPATGKKTTHPVTGRLRIDSGTTFALENPPFMYFCIWPEANTEVTGKLFLLSDE